MQHCFCWSILSPMCKTCCGFTTKKHFPAYFHSDMKMLSTANKLEFERKKSGMHSDISVVVPHTMLQHNPR